MIKKALFFLFVFGAAFSTLQAQNLDVYNLTCQDVEIEVRMKDPGTCAATGIFFSSITVPASPNVQSFSFGGINEIYSVQVVEIPNPGNSVLVFDTSAPSPCGTPNQVFPAIFQCDTQPHGAELSGGPTTHTLHIF